MSDQFSFDPGLASVIHTAAAAEGITYSEMIERAVRFYLEEICAYEVPEPKLLTPTPGLAIRFTPLASVPTDLLEALLQPEPCRLDHDGDCQAHGYFGMGPGEQCPQARLRALLEKAGQ